MNITNAIQVIAQVALVVIIVAAVGYAPLAWLANQGKSASHLPLLRHLQSRKTRITYAVVFSVVMVTTGSILASVITRQIMHEEHNVVQQLQALNAYSPSQPLDVSK
jgi:hypothetical protein